MNIKFINILIIIFLFSCSQKQKFIDENEIRIISLSPHITEIIYELKMDSSLVAVTDFCKYPAEAQENESIGGLLNPNIEKIVTLRPTHLLGQPSHARLNQDLSKFGLSIIMMSNETLGDIKNTITKISDTLNIQDKGEQLIRSIDKGINESIKLSIRKSNPRAMLVIGREKDSIKNITVVGPDTYLNEIWEMMGGKNIFDDLSVRYGAVNLEEIIKRNPDVIIEFDFNAIEGMKNITPGDEWQYLQNVNAVNQQQIFEIGGNYSLIPGPRVIKLANDFNNILNLIDDINK